MGASKKKAAKAKAKAKPRGGARCRVTWKSGLASVVNFSDYQAKQEHYHVNAVRVVDADTGGVLFEAEEAEA